MRQKKISVVLGTYNRLKFLRLTIDSLRKELTGTAHEIIVVDGGSTDGTLKWLARQKDIIVIVQHNRGKWMGTDLPRRSWGYFMNLGFKCAQGKFVCMVSDDCLIIPGAVLNGIEYFEREIQAGKKAGAVAFYWRNWPEEELYRVGLTLGGRIFVNHGIFLKEALEEAGYADEETYSFYHGDGDLCLKLWHKGYVCLDAPNSYLEHFNHANLLTRKANSRNQQADWTAYIEKWRGIFDAQDDAYLEKAYSDDFRTAGVFQNSNFVKRSLLVRKLYGSLPVSVRGMLKKALKG